MMSFEMLNMLDMVKQWELICFALTFQICSLRTICILYVTNMFKIWVAFALLE